MMFKRIDHIEIVTAKPDETVQFYTDVLGFHVRSRDHIERPGGSALDLVYLDLGGTTVELLSWQGVPIDPEPKLEHLGYRMMALEVDDMDKTVADLKEKGVAVVWGPM